MCRPIEDISGVILAGGQSKRFGSNKSFALFHGISFIKRVEQVMRPLFSDLLMVTNTPEVYKSPSYTVITDDIPHQGPLGGIVTALRKAKHERIFVVACDMPLLDANDIVQIIDAGNGYDAVIPQHGERREYLLALYSRRLLNPMDLALRSGQRSLKGFFKDRPNIAWVPVEAKSSFNINTKQDLAHLEVTHAV